MSMSLGCTFLSGANTIAGAINTTSNWDKANVIVQGLILLITAGVLRMSVLTLKSQLLIERDRKKLQFLNPDYNESFCIGKAIKDEVLDCMKIVKGDLYYIILQ